MSRNSNLFETIASEGTDRQFVPRITSEFRPTNAGAGSRAKIDVLRWRLEHGFPLFHELDEADAVETSDFSDLSVAECAAEVD